MIWDGKWSILTKYDFFDNMKVLQCYMFLVVTFILLIPCSVFFFTKQDLKARQALPILSAHLTILKSYIEHLKVPINEMFCFVAPAFRMSLDPNQEKFLD